jgi:microcystin degradation protein MlrC
MTQSPRLFIASVANETNTFSPLRTDLRDFKDSFYALPGEHPDTPTLCSAVFPVASARSVMEGWTLIEGLATWAEPGGLVNQQTWEFLRDSILDQLRSALPVDAVLLGLHGAMVAQNCDDCEGEILELIRAIVGPDIFVGATLDPHSHLTPKRVENADALIAFKEFPHTDFVAAAEQLVDIAAKSWGGEAHPIMSVFDCRMIELFPTSIEPMRSFVDNLKKLEQRPDILSLSVIHGFMAADVPHIGTKIIAITDNAKEEGDRLTQELGMELYSHRGKTRQEFLHPDAAVKRAVSIDKGPVVIADIWDNPGGGVPGDSTILLRTILDHGLDNVALATIWDPIAVRTCISAGEGASLRLRFGGKMSDQAGEPIDADIIVKKISRDAVQSFGGSIVPIGDAVTIQMKGVELILNTVRSQVFNPDIFWNMDINPLKKDFLVVKSTNHFYDAFSPIASEIVYATVDGPYPNDPVTNNYTQISRPIWPINKTPHGSAEVAS